jgi:hypothetical protein
MYVIFLYDVGLYITTPRFHTTPHMSKALRFTSEERAEQFMARWYAHFDREDFHVVEFVAKRERAR